MPTNFNPFPPRRRSLGTTLRGLKFWLQRKYGKAEFASLALPNLSLRVQVGARTLFARQITKYGSYETDNTNWLLSCFGADRGGLFVDVGANFGWYSMVFSKCAGRNGKVIAIEPDSKNFELLARNIRDNGLSNLVALNVGVGAERTQATLSALDASNPGAHSVRPVAAALESTLIEIHRLDELLSDHPGAIEVLKVDIEGYEIEALQGATETLGRTRRVLIEYSPRFLRACGHEPQELLELLRSHGFRPNLVERGALKQTTFSDVLMSVEDMAPSGRWQVDLVLTRAEPNA